MYVKHIDILHREVQIGDAPKIQSFLTKNKEMKKSYRGEQS